MSWFVEVVYKSQSGLKTEKINAANRAVAMLHYHRWERNPERFSEVFLYEEKIKFGIKLKPRLHMKAQGYMFDDEIPF